MSRRRWIYIDGEAHEITADYVEPARPVDSGALWGDSSYAGLRATDGTPIDTRTKHREYMRLNGLTTVDDFKDSFAQAEKQRDAYRTGQKGTGAVRREHIERAIHELTEGKKR